MSAPPIHPRLPVPGLAGLLALASAIACSAAASGRTVPPAGPTLAAGYPEAALVDMYRNGQLGAYCSGALVAPSVVLTAGHCVKGASGFVPDAWTVALPYNRAQRIDAAGAATYDWETTDGTVDPGKHDVGLVFLAAPARVAPAQCPALAAAPVTDASSIVHIGRLRRGRISTSDLFVGDAVPVTDGAAAGFPFDYGAEALIEAGDSGGPVEVPGASPHLIVAVSSAAAPGQSEVLARVDLVGDWIRRQILEHGGPCGPL
ncbi:MAG TPA: trypsin-like serine protease [Polyangiaceae bacterium]